MKIVAGVQDTRKNKEDFAITYGDMSRFALQNVQI